MTLGDAAVKARMLTHTDTVSWTDAQLLIDINIWYQKVVPMILESSDASDFDDNRNTNYPMQTTPMVASQRDYLMPVSENMLKVKRVDISYDGSHYYRATPMDDGAWPYGIGNDTDVDSYFTTVAPRYDIKYNSLFIFPMPTATDVANGGTLRVEWERNITPFTTSDYTSVLTDSTVKFGFDAPFHPIIPLGAAFEYGSANSLPQLQVWAGQLQDWEQRIRQHYGRRDWDMNLALAPRIDNFFGR